MFKNFPHYHQHDAMDCGATCLRMIAKYYHAPERAYDVDEKAMYQYDEVFLKAVELIKTTAK